jgi:hypothetical protein
MDFHEYVVYYGLISFTLWAIYKFLKDQEAEMRRLRERNSTLARWLQLAELQTGIAYYSAIANEAVPYEGNVIFFRALQERIKNPGFAAPPPQEPQVEEPGEPVLVD